MNRDDIIREADEWLRMNGKSCRPPHYDMMVLFSQHIAALVAAAERESCAKVCDEDGMLWGARYAARIRAEGGPKRAQVGQERAG